MSRVRVVLVRPQVAGNIGATARLMENFGAGLLYLVNPEADPDSLEAQRRSTHGAERLKAARSVSSVAEALDGVVFTVGTSSRRGPVHQPEDIAPRRMAEMVRGKLAVGEVALMFGTEDNGLSREELLACDILVRIPAQPDYPTLNLSHAVAICLYEVFVATVTERPIESLPGERTAADGAMMSRLMDKLQHALLTLGYLRPEKPDHLMFPIRAILSRANLTRTEAQILMGLAQQIDEFAQYGRK